MKKLLFIFAILLTYSSCVSFADEITFVDGRKITGKVLEYEDNIVKIRQHNGEVVTEKIAEIKQIVFDSLALPEKPEKVRVPPKIKREINARFKQATEALKLRRTSGRTFIVLYLDTENSRGSIPKSVDYEIQYSGNAVSPIGKPIPLRKASIITASPDPEAKLELDPGPPYEIMKIDAGTKEGKVTNLGRIVLKKTKANGTASIYGTVRDFAGNPIPNAEVAAGTKTAVSDQNGNYKIDGFGLEVVSLKASKNGHSGKAVKVAIRNMDTREIKQDLAVIRPHRVRFRYAISGTKDDSFVGSDVETGTAEVVVDSRRNDIIRDASMPENFARVFLPNSLELNFRFGELRFFMGGSWAYAQMSQRFQVAAPGVEFDSIKEGNSSWIANTSSSQKCPSLHEGNIVIIRNHSKKGTRGNITEETRFVKVLIEELSVSEN